MKASGSSGVVGQAVEKLNDKFDHEGRDGQFLFLVVLRSVDDRSARQFGYSINDENFSIGDVDMATTKG